MDNKKKEYDITYDEMTEYFYEDVEVTVSHYKLRNDTLTGKIVETNWYWDFNHSNFAPKTNRKS